VNAWTPVGPDAGFVNTFAVAAGPAGAIYAATADAGVWKSTDRGATWSPANGQLGDLGVLDLRADPVDPATLYAATATALYKTVDGGATWRPILNGYVAKVAVAPSSPITVYAEFLWLGHIPRVYRSRDGGATWRFADFGLRTSPLGPFGLEIDPRDWETVFTLFALGVDATADAGRHWKEVLPIEHALEAAISLALDPHAPGTLLAGSSEVRRSVDGGATWSATTGIEVRRSEVTSLAFDPRISGVAYAGTGPGPAWFPFPGVGRIYKSVDGGATWNRQVDGLDQVNALAVDPLLARRVFAATDRGVLRTLNGGRSWADANRGLRASQIRSVTFDPGAPRTLYATAEANEQFLGVFKSTDGGGSWVPALQGLGSVTFPARVAPVGRVIAVPGAPLYAAGSGQLDRSLDGGATWQPLHTGNTLVFDADVDPTSPRTVYAVGSLDSVCQGLYCPPIGHVNLSTDGGTTFTDITERVNPSETPGLLATVTIDKASGTVYLSGELTFRSTDRGATWTRLPLGPGIRSLAVDPAAPSTLYAVDKTTLWRSTNSDDSWSPIGGLPAGPGFELRRVAVDPSGSGAVYLATSQGVYASFDHAATWAPLGNLASLSVLTVAVDPFDPTKIYAGTARGGGLFVYSRR
jgi:photosystem II stability/assembly factor-like uncharacterized protein